MASSDEGYSSDSSDNGDILLEDVQAGLDMRYCVTISGAYIVGEVKVCIACYHTGIDRWENHHHFSAHQTYTLPIRDVTCCDLCRVKIGMVTLQRVCLVCNRP